MNIRVLRNVALALTLSASLVLLPEKPAHAENICSPACQACIGPAYTEFAQCMGSCGTDFYCQVYCLNTYGQRANYCLSLP